MAGAAPGTRRRRAKEDHVCCTNQGSLPSAGHERLLDCSQQCSGLWSLAQSSVDGTVEGDTIMLSASSRWQKLASNGAATRRPPPAAGPGAKVQHLGHGGGDHVHLTCPGMAWWQVVHGCTRAGSKLPSWPGTCRGNC